MANIVEHFLDGDGVSDFEALTHLAERLAPAPDYRNPTEWAHNHTIQGRQAVSLVSRKRSVTLGRG